MTMTKSDDDLGGIDLKVSNKPFLRPRARSFSSIEKVTRVDSDLLRRGPRLPPSSSELDRIHCHVGLQDFGLELQKAANAIFPGEERSRYTKVDVILLSWEDEDPNLPVSLEIKELADIFDQIYSYDVAQYLIPSDDSHNRLQGRILQFLNRSDPRHLKIVYYAGHGKLMNHGSLAWTSRRNSGKERCPTVKWSGIQNTLEESRSDVLILLDCCAAGTCTTDEGNGVTELIAACAYNAIANGVGPFSFTHALNAKLRILAQRPFFTIGYLYNCLFTEVQGWRTEDARHKKAPVHLVLSQNDGMPRSIRLSGQSFKKRGVQSSTAPLPTLTNEESRSENVSLKSISLSGESESSHANFLSPNTSLSSSTSSSCIGNMPQYPRLLFSVRVEENIKPKDLSVEFFADWLRDIPVAARLVRVEAGFASDSTILMVSMPAAMLGYIPSDPAFTLLGTIRSTNILAVQEQNMVAPIQQHNFVEPHAAGSHIGNTPHLRQTNTPVAQSQSEKLFKEISSELSLLNSSDNRGKIDTARTETASFRNAPSSTSAKSIQVIDLTGSTPSEDYYERKSDSEFIDSYSIEAESDSDVRTKDPIRVFNISSRPTSPESESSIISESVGTSIHNAWNRQAGSCPEESFPALSHTVLPTPSASEDRSGSRSTQSPWVTRTEIPTSNDCLSPPKSPRAISNAHDMPFTHSGQWNNPKNSKPTVLSYPTPVTPQIVTLSDYDTSGSLIRRVKPAYAMDISSSYKGRGKEVQSTSLGHLLQQQATLEGNKSGPRTNVRGSQKPPTSNSLKRPYSSLDHCPTCAHMGRESIVMAGNSCAECGTNC